MADAVGRILVVEDEPLIRQLLLTALGGRGHKIETCPNGAEGLQALKGGSFDVLITDFHMPRMTGIQLIEAVRASKVKIATILMSSNNLDELALTGKELEGVQFLRKPFGINELFASVQRALKSPSR
ncbi:MAG TPA: response regulator [Planctomycetota bacterium]|nr:response regulator [Planctomycetota bacterium]